MEPVNIGLFIMVFVVTYQLIGRLVEYDRK